MTTTKLSDIQLILLTTAAQRADGSVLPPPDSLGDRAPRIRTAIGGLFKRLLVAETIVSDAAQVRREDGDSRIGLAITDAGRSAIGVNVADGDALEQPPVDTVAVLDTAMAPASKIAAVVAMLQRDGGATLPELTEATGWLPHTTRAALSGLRKKGHAIEKSRREGVTAYLVTAAA
jgi:hypothetical protein